MNSCKFSFLTFVVVASLSLAVLRAFVDGSLSTSGVNGPPSPPRNLRRTVLGVIGDDREYQVRWSASKDNGGRAVNYTLKMCSTWNASFCKDIHNQNCQAINVVSTTEEFFCILEHKDFLSCGEFCDYILCAVASNDFGKSESCIRAPYVDAARATPRPPLHFEVLNSKDGGVTVRWQERDYMKYFGRLYTVLYHGLNQPLANKTKEVANQTSLSLSGLQAFTTYCVYLMVQFVNGRKERSAHSSVLGPSCNRTPPGEPTDPPQVVTHQNLAFPGNASLRNVAVQWELAQNLSWRGTPYQYQIFCNYHMPMGRGPLAKKCEYHTDAATNKTVLQGLSSDDSYNVYIRMCNREEKCSGRGRSYLVRAQEGVRTSEATGAKTQVALISLPVIFGCVVAVCAVWLTRKWRRLNRPQRGLDELLEGVEDLDHNNYDYIRDDHAEYDRVNAPREENV